MRDDERYPTPVFSEDAAALNAPEVVSHSYMDPRGHDKISPDPTPDPTSAGASPSPWLSSGKEIASGPSPQKTYCGLRKKTFIVAGIVAVVIIAAIVGGVVGGLAASGKLSGSDGESGTKDGDGDGDGGSIGRNERFLAAARTPGSSDEQHIHIFYQSLESPEISYRHLTDDKSGTRWPVKLEIEPIMGTPLAAVALDVGYNTQLFYLSEGSGSNNVTVTQASLDCKGDDCSVLSNQQLSGPEESGVYEHSKLAAFRWKQADGDQVRVFYQSAGNESLWVTGGWTKESDSWTSEHLVSGALAGTGISACGPNSTEINVYYVDAKSNVLRVFEYDDGKGPASGDDEVVYQKDTQALNDTVSLSAAWLAEQAPLRVFYAEPDGAQISAYWRNKETSKGTPDYEMSDSPEWGHVEGGLASVGWGAELRLYYFQEGELMYNARNPPDRWDAAKSVAS